EFSLLAASEALRTRADFDHFDRLAWLAGPFRNAARDLDGLRRATVTTAVTMPRALRADAASPYASGAFDPLAYAPRGASLSPELVSTGAQLFSDPELSGNGTRSCASCHQPAKAF